MTTRSFGWHTAIRLATLALGLALVRPAGAQRVHGTVHDSASTQPVSGVVLTLYDSLGRMTVRTISDEQGRYSLPIDNRSTRLRAIRIGFQPREAPLVRAAGGDVRLDLTMSAIPAMLTGVRVAGRPLCPGAGDHGLAFNLWEQARAGLLASVVAREAKPADVSTLLYERRLSPNDDRVRSQTLQKREGRSSRPFLAFAEPAVFARAGYMKEDASGRTYYAPDADVLLDESFAITHCFTLTIDKDHPAQVGIAFEPAPQRGRDTMVDVTGVIWLDRDHPQLRTLEFEYTAIEPVAATVHTGGTISFRTMSNGIVLIDWWSMRLPVMTATMVPSTMTSSSQPMPERRTDRRNLRVTEVQSSGGELLTAKWKDGIAITLEPGRITGRVVEKGTSRGHKGAVVSLAGTYDEVVTDSVGAFVFAPVIPGKYTISVSDTLLSDIVDARSVSRSIDVARGERATVELRVPPLTEVVAHACQGTTMGPETSILLGSLQDSTGAPVRNVVVSARWLAAAEIVGAVMQAHHTERTYQVDDAGRFRFCGVVRERPIQLTVRGPDGVAISDTSVFAYDLIQRYVWRVRAKPGAAPVGSDSTVASKPKHPAVWR